MRSIKNRTICKAVLDILKHLTSEEVGPCTEP